MIRSTLLASAIVAVASIASAGGTNSVYGKSGNHTYDYSKTVVDRSAYGNINNTYDFSSVGTGRDLSASAGATVGSGASQNTTSNALRNGSSTSWANASNVAKTGSGASALAGFASAANSAKDFGNVFGRKVFGTKVDFGLGAAGVVDAGGSSNTNVKGSTNAGNHSTGSGNGTADAAQYSFGQSNADADVALFDVNQKLITKETGSTSEWFNSNDVTKTHPFGH